jgi:(p)ppGpp synthase/HD superfamily hydrolase
MNTILEQVRDFADRAHGTQMRKYTPDRYIVHTIRVMELCSRHTTDNALLSAALLHDVPEDTPVTAADIETFLHTLMSPEDTARTLKLVTELTDVYVKADYPQWNRKIRRQHERERISRTSPDAQTIKYADLIDNCKEIVKHDRQFAGKFLVECEEILKVITKGNTILYEEAVQTIKSGLKLLKNR